MHTSKKHNHPEGLEYHPTTPCPVVVYRKMIECVAEVSCKVVAKEKPHVVAIDQDAAYVRRRYLTHPDRNGCDDGPSAPTSYEAEGKKHSQACAAGQTCCRQKIDEGTVSDRHLPTKAVRDNRHCPDTEETTSLVKRVHESGPSSGVVPNIELEIGDEGGLSQCCCYDGCTVPILDRTQRHEQDDGDIVPAELALVRVLESR